MTCANKGLQVTPLRVGHEPRRSVKYQLMNNIDTSSKAAATSDLCGVVHSAIDGFMKSLKGSLNCPGILWHYTNADALQAILNSKSIYATHYEYLNDPSELIFFTKIAHSIAWKRLEMLPKVSDNQIMKTSEEFESGLWTIILEQNNLLCSNAPFVVCFGSVKNLSHFCLAFFHWWWHSSALPPMGGKNLSVYTATFSL